MGPGSIRTCAVVLAAGQGRRMGADKALLQLGRTTVVERVVRACREGGVAAVVVVRRHGAAALPEGLDAEIVEVAAGGEMLASVQAGIGAVPGPCAAALVFPVDYALVRASTVAAVCRLLDGGAAIALPLFADRPGHPIGLRRDLFGEALAARQSLREVIAADGGRVQAVAVDDAWIARDLDTKEDLAAAAASLRSGRESACELMRRHRTHRSFCPAEIPDEQLEWLVDSARYASTSSFIQAYSVVAVRDPARREAVAELCGEQQHIREAPVFLAICADLHKINLACQRHGKTLRWQPVEAFVEALVDASLVAQNLLLGAESEGLAGCFIGGARQHPRELAALLDLPPHCFVAFGLVLGLPADDPLPRGRMPLSGVLHHERYRKDGLETVLDAADEQMRAWSRRTNAAGGYKGRKVSETKGWTDRMAAKWSREFGLREELAAWLAALGFGLD